VFGERTSPRRRFPPPLLNRGPLPLKKKFPPTGLVQPSQPVWDFWGLKFRVKGGGFHLLPPSPPWGVDTNGYLLKGNFNN